MRDCPWSRWRPKILGSPGEHLDPVIGCQVVDVEQTHRGLGTQDVELDATFGVTVLPLVGGDQLVEVRNLGRVVDLGNQVRIGWRDHRLRHVPLEPRRGDRVDPHHPLLPTEVDVGQPTADRGAGRVLVLGSHRIFEIEDEGVGISRQRLGEHLLVGPRHEMSRATNGHGSYLR